MSQEKFTYILKESILDCGLFDNFQVIISLKVDLNCKFRFNLFGKYGIYFVIYVLDLDEFGLTTNKTVTCYERCGEVSYKLSYLL